MKWLAVGFLLVALSGCVNYAGEAAQLRGACSSGDHASCIDYEALIRTCTAPFSVLHDVACQGVGPQTFFHRNGAETQVPGPVMTSVLQPAPAVPASSGKPPAQAAVTVYTSDYQQRMERERAASFPAN